MAQFLRPDSNVTQTSFTNGFDAIDESSASDADFAYGTNNTAAVLEVGLSNPSGTPGAGTTTVRYRVAKTNAGTVDGGGNAVTVTASVYQGGTLIAEDSARTVTGTWTEYSWTPSMASVTDWNDLRLRFTTSASGGSPANRRGGAVSWAEVESPDPVQALTAPLYSNTNAFYAATIGVGAVGLTPGLYSDAQTFHAATVSPGAVGLVAGLYSNAAAYYAATVATSAVYSRVYWADVGLQPLLLNTSAFYGPTVALGGVVLTAARLDNTSSFYTHSLSSSGVSDLQPTRLDNAASFYAATVATGAVDLTPGLYDNTSAFYAATVAAGAVDLTPTRLDNSGAFYGPTITVGAVDLTPARLDNSQSFYSATITTGAFDLAAVRFDNSQSFYGPTITTGGVELTADRLNNANTFYTHAAAPGSVDILPELLTNAQAWYVPTVGVAAVNLLPTKLDNNQTWFTQNVSTLTELVVTRFNNDSSFYSFVVSNGSGVYPPPYQVLLGVNYGPTGVEYTGTLEVFDKTLKYNISEGTFVKPLTNKVVMSL